MITPHQSREIKGRKLTMRRTAIHAGIGIGIGITAMLALAGCAGAAPEVTGSTSPSLSPPATAGALPTFKLTSDTVAAGEEFPLAQRSAVFGVPGGKDVSPQLSWSGFPDETKSFIVSVYDPDAPTGSGFWHWTVANIPASVTSLPEGAGTRGSKRLPAGAVQVPNDAGLAQYIGAAPPSGTHEYQITVTALGVSGFTEEQRVTSPLVQFYASGSTLARATITVPATAGKGN